MTVSEYTKSINDSCRYATDDELDWMSEFSKSLGKDSLVVMLGAGTGSLLLGLKDGRRDLHAVVIDHNNYYYAEAHLKGNGYEKNVEFVLGDSVDIGKSWGKKIDLLIVDTDHTENTTRQEIDIWMPHVESGGLIFFHDYDPVGTWFEDKEQYPGVKVAVDDRMSGYQFVRRVGTAIIFKKRAKKKS